MVCQYPWNLIGGLRFVMLRLWVDQDAVYNSAGGPRVKHRLHLETVFVIYGLRDWLTCVGRGEGKTYVMLYFMICSPASIQCILCS
jgi:hypothetical protein